MVNPASWFAFKALTVPDLPILISKVLSMSTPLLSSGGLKEGTLVYWTVVGDSARLLPTAFASLFAASRVLAMLYAVFVGFVCGIAPVGPCSHLACSQSFALVFLQLMMSIGVLVATSAVAGKVLPECFWLEISCPMTEMTVCYCGAAIVLVIAPALSYLFMKLGAATAAANIEEYGPASLFVVDGDFTSDLLLTSAALASVGINMKRRFCWNILDWSPCALVL